MKRGKARCTDPTPEQRAEVIDRAKMRCERCGTYLGYAAYSIHHRLPRGRGGRNELSNLVLLCGSATSPDTCHAFVESRREQAYDEGWLVRSEMDPAEVPVAHVAFGRVLLDNDGGYAEAA